jgi:hypothetical protein
MTQGWRGNRGQPDAAAFQHHFRDIHVLTPHGFICASRYESVGRQLLGLDSEWGFFAF